MLTTKYETFPASGEPPTVAPIAKIVDKIDINAESL